ncbi:MAG: DUF3263 domain-containing protein [Bifidobacteriaceae bacterium]|jgi:hypothetical protein|nr:DUF3263 domain-containing protein [Bifidobacteriaceae bacterium]
MRVDGTAVRQSDEVSAGTGQGAEGSGLSERDRGILMFERQWWRYEGPKEEAIRNLFGVDATRYYQILGTLIDTREALVFDPQLVKRLRRLRSARQRSRSARRLTDGRDEPFTVSLTS